MSKEKQIMSQDRNIEYDQRTFRIVAIIAAAFLCASVFMLSAAKAWNAVSGDHASSHLSATESGDQ